MEHDVQCSLKEGDPERDEEEYETAIHVGWELLNSSERPEDEDVAGLALALAGAGELEEAGRLLDSRPGLDPSNSLVR